jgi:hypothetical protein
MCCCLTNNLLKKIIQVCTYYLLNFEVGKEIDKYLNYYNKANIYTTTVT